MSKIKEETETTVSEKIVLQEVQKDEKENENKNIPPISNETVSLEHHPDDDIDIQGMKVAELRLFLKERGLSTAGRKAELQSRLFESLEEARVKRAKSVNLLKESCDGVLEKKVDDNIDTLEVKAATSATENESRMSIDVTDCPDCDKVNHPESTKSECTEATQFFDTMEVDSQANESITGPSEARKSVATEEFGHIDSNTISTSEARFNSEKSQVNVAENQPGIKKQSVSSSVSQSSKEQTSSSKSILSGNEDKRSSVASIISASSVSTCSTIPTLLSEAKTSITESLGERSYKKSTSSNDSCISTSSIRALAESKEKEKLAKQQARLEAMRGKARNEVESATRVNETASISKKVNGLLNNRPMSSVLKSANKENMKSADGHSMAMAKTEQHKRLIAQMRERAQGKILQANQNIMTNSTSAPKKQVTVETKIKSDVQELNQNNEIKKNENAEESKRQGECPRSPMDTYEMSDREGSESESDSDDEYAKKSNKRIPNWARSANLIPALEKQFGNGPERIDPDTIFPEVETCDLEKIFDRKKNRYVRRTSSGNWSHDRVTIQEKLVYKRQMGYQQR